MTQPTKQQLAEWPVPNSPIGFAFSVIKLFGPWAFSWVVLGFLWVSYEKKNQDVSTLANSVITLMGETNKSISDLTRSIDKGHDKVDDMAPAVSSLLDAVKANGKQLDSTGIIMSENNNLLHELNTRVKGNPQTQ